MLRFKIETSPYYPSVARIVSPAFEFTVRGRTVYGPSRTSSFKSELIPQVEGLAFDIDYLEEIAEMTVDVLAQHGVPFASVSMGFVANEAVTPFPTTYKRHKAPLELLDHVSVFVATEIHLDEDEARQIAWEIPTAVDYDVTGAMLSLLFTGTRSSRIQAA